MLTQLTVGSYYIGYLFVTLFICWWINWKTTRFNRLLNKIPGPSPLPFLGSVLSFIGGFDSKFFYINIIVFNYLINNVYFLLFS